MRKTPIVLTLVAVASLVAGGTETSLAGADNGPGLGNSGLAAGERLAQIAPLHRATPNNPEFHPVKLPRTGYTTSTCLTDLSAIADYTRLDHVDSNCGVTMTFNVTMEKRSVPDSWATWASPPKSEGNTPDILYTDRATAIIVSYDAPQTEGGFEAEPNRIPARIHRGRLLHPPERPG